MPSLHIERLAVDRYAVRQYDRVLSVDLGEMSGEKLHGHLTARRLVGRTPQEVIDTLEVAKEITVQFHTF